jgi:hypothetical protein
LVDDLLPGTTSTSPRRKLQAVGHADAHFSLHRHRGLDGATEATRLFTDRAAQHGAPLTWDERTAPVAGRICRLLDGMPLAIELAAARLRVMPVTELDSRLDQRFSILTGGSRAGLARQQTLRAMVDWSWELLNAAERHVLARLSVFAESLDLARRVQMKASIAYALIGLAMAGSGADGGRSARLHGAADQALAVLGETVEPLEGGLRDLDRQRLRAAMGDEAFEAGYAAGRALAPGEALALALGNRGLPARRSRPAAGTIRCRAIDQEYRATI